MIKYAQLVDYIKANHVNWNTDLFEVLRGFFEQYTQSLQYSLPPPPISPTQLFPKQQFKEPKEREYTIQDLINLFSS